MISPLLDLLSPSNEDVIIDGLSEVMRLNSKLVISLFGYHEKFI